MKTVDVNMW